MAPDGTKTNQVSISHSGTTITTFFAGDEWLDAVDEFVEKSEFQDRSTAMRSMMLLGMREYTVGDPRKDQNRAETESDDEFSPVTVRDLIPEGEENAVSLKDELPDIIDEKMLEIVEEDPEIRRNGWEVYR